MPCQSSKSISKLNIESPVGFEKLPSRDAYNWKPYGYREYNRITVKHIECLWLDEMLLFFQMVNTALCYPGRVYVFLPDRPKYGYRTFPDPDKIAIKMAEAGFLITQQGTLLIGEK